jgi:GNAT superfamily N-acetyltransferase
MRDELNQFSRDRFVGSNSLIFSPPWSDEQIDWWQQNIFKPHGLYPDDLGEKLSASIQGDKTVTLLDMNPKTNSFVIRVKGLPEETGEAWWHQRALDLTGRLFRAEKMVVPFNKQKMGVGRFLMADLVDTAAKLGIKQISIEAEDVGRYAWARFGFVPDRTAWMYHVRIEARMRLLRSSSQIDPKNLAAYRELLDKENPRLIREVARWTDQVDSIKEFDVNGHPEKVALGKAVLLETPANWFGTFDLEDAETMDIFKRYVGRNQ